MSVRPKRALVPLMVFSHAPVTPPLAAELQIIARAMAVVFAQIASQTRTISRDAGNPVVELKVKDQNRDVGDLRTVKGGKREPIRLSMIKPTPAQLLVTPHIWQ